MAISSELVHIKAIIVLKWEFIGRSIKFKTFHLNRYIKCRSRLLWFGFKFLKPVSYLCVYKVLNKITS